MSVDMDTFPMRETLDLSAIIIVIQYTIDTIELKINFMIVFILDDDVCPYS
jgi:hypothetical protein